MRTLIRNIRIFDGSPESLRDGAILIEGDHIARVVYAPDDLLPHVDADAVIDGRGQTLMPGLIDAHCHLTWGSSVDKIYHQFMLPPEELKVAAQRNAGVLLDHGFTSVWSGGALGDGIEAQLAAEIAAGTTPGPRLLPSTLERSPEGEDTGNIFNGRGADAMRGFIAHCAAQGVKVVKLVISGEDALKPGSSQDILYTAQELAAAGDAAKAAGLWIAAHAYTPQAIRMAIAAGARIIYHASFADQATIDLMAAHKDSVFYAPGCGVSVAALEASPPPHVDMSAMKASAAQRMELEAKLVPQLHKRGVRVLIGGDYGFPFNPHGRNARDLAHFVDYLGFSPVEALSAATKLGGELLDLPVGQVKEGFLADLLLVDGDVTDDVAILQDKSRLTMIMQGGKLHKAPADLAVA